MDWVRPESFLPPVPPIPPTGTLTGTSTSVAPDISALQGVNRPVDPQSYTSRSPCTWTALVHRPRLGVRSPSTRPTTGDPGRVTRYGGGRLSTCTHSKDGTVLPLFQDEETCINLSRPLLLPTFLYCPWKSLSSTQWTLPNRRVRPQWPVSTCTRELKSSHLTPTTQVSEGPPFYWALLKSFVYNVFTRGTSSPCPCSVGVFDHFDLQISRT